MFPKSKWSLASAIFLSFVSILLFFAAFNDLTFSKIPEHELLFLNQTQEQLPKNTVRLILIFTQMIGSWYIAISSALIYLTYRYCWKLDKQAFVAIVCVTLLPNILIQIFTSDLGFGPNVIASYAVITLSILGLCLNLIPLLSKTENKK